MRDRGKGKKREIGPRVNHHIRIPECRLLGDDGVKYDVVSIERAREIADELGLDLVEVSPNAKPPVVKLIDYGKFKYNQQKKANENKKKQAVVQLKEIQFRPNIEEHDLETKLKRGHKFLVQGDKVKMVMQFRGREMAYRDVGLAKFNNIIEMIIKLGAQIESPAKMMGNRIIAILSPDKKGLKAYRELQAREDKLDLLDEKIASEGEELPNEGGGPRLLEPEQKAEASE